MKAKNKKKPAALLQQINTKKKIINVFCNTEGIINKPVIRKAWGTRLPGYAVKFINCKTGKTI